MKRLAAVVSFLVLAAPAASQSGSTACEAYVPTGEALPRQDTVRSNATLNPSAGPSYRDRRVGNVRRGDVVTIIQECGPVVRIRSSEGVDGWLSVGFLPNEQRLAREANARPATTEEDCRLRWQTVPDAREGCIANLAQQKVRAAEIAGARYLDPAELKTFLSARSLEVWQREADREKVIVGRNYFAPNGEYFLRAQGPNFRNLWRGWYVLKDNVVCLPDTRFPCARLRRLGTGRTLWVTTAGVEFDIEAKEGDPDGIAAEVSVQHPRPRRPPVPADITGIEAPSLGR